MNILCGALFTIISIVGLLLYFVNKINNLTRNSRKKLLSGNISSQWSSVESELNLINSVNMENTKISNGIKDVEIMNTKESNLFYINKYEIVKEIEVRITETKDSCVQTESENVPEEYSEEHSEEHSVIDDNIDIIKIHKNMLSLSHSEKSIINCDKKFLEFPYVISLHKKIKKLEETKLEMEGKLNIINLKCSDLISKKNITDFLKNEKNEILIGKDEEIIKLKTKLKKLSTDLENAKITLRNCKEEHSLEWKKMEAENKLALNNLNSEKIKELEKMKLNNEKVLDELKNKKNVELKVNNIENNIKIEKLKISQQEEIENLKIENKKEIEKKDFILKNEINSMISNNEIKLTKLKTENMIEIDRIEKEKQIEIDILNMEKNAKIFIIEEEQKESIEIIQKEKNNLCSIIEKLNVENKINFSAINEIENQKNVEFDKYEIEKNRLLIVIEENEKIHSEKIIEIENIKTDNNHLIKIVQKLEAEKTEKVRNENYISCSNEFSSHEKILRKNSTEEHSVRNFSEECSSRNDGKNVLSSDSIEIEYSEDKMYLNAMINIKEKLAYDLSTAEAENKLQNDLKIAIKEKNNAEINARLYRRECIDLKKEVFSVKKVFTEFKAEIEIEKNQEDNLKILNIEAAKQRSNLLAHLEVHNNELLNQIKSRDEQILLYENKIILLNLKLNTSENNYEEAESEIKTLKSLIINLECDKVKLKKELIRTPGKNVLCNMPSGTFFPYTTEKDLESISQDFFPGEHSDEERTFQYDEIYNSGLSPVDLFSHNHNHTPIQPSPLSQKNNENTISVLDSRFSSSSTSDIDTRFFLNSGLHMELSSGSGIGSGSGPRSSSSSGSTQTSMESPLSVVSSNLSYTDSSVVSKSNSESESMREGNDNDNNNENTKINIELNTKIQELIEVKMSHAMTSSQLDHANLKILNLTAELNKLTQLNNNNNNKSANNDNNENKNSIDNNKNDNNNSVISNVNINVNKNKIVGYNNNEKLVLEINPLLPTYKGRKTVKTAQSFTVFEDKKNLTRNR